MKIKLHLMGSLKQGFESKGCSHRELEISETATSRDLLRLFGVEDRNILTIINGKPTNIDTGFHEGDRVVLMDPDYSDVCSANNN